MKGVNVFGRLACLVFSVYASAASAGTIHGPWLWQRPLVTGARLNAAVTNGSGAVIAVGDSGAVLESPDGSAWAAVRTLYSDYTTNVVTDDTTFTAVTYWNGLYIAGGDSGILTSSDGKHWSATNLYPEIWTGIGVTSFAVAGSHIIATGGPAGQDLYASSDGKSWKLVTGLDFPPEGLAQALNGEFYVTLWNSITTSLELEVSADGQTWAQDSSFPSGASGVLVSSGSLMMSFANGKVYTTSDGNTWSGPLSTPLDTGLLQWTGREFVLVSEVAPTYYTSADGTSWTSQPLPADGVTITSSSDVTGLVWTGSQYVAIGLAGAIYTSPDGSTWTAVSTPGKESFESAVWDGSKFLVYGQRGKQFSGDGTSWTMTPLTGAAATSVAQVTKGDQIYLGFAALAASGGGGFVGVSTDGIAWQAVSGLTQSYTSSAQCGNTAVTLSSNDSGNGVWSAAADVSSGFLTWTEKLTPFTTIGIGLACGNGVFVADLQESIATSTDGLTWTAMALPSNTVSNAVTFQNGMFIVMAQKGELFTSTDAVNWAHVLPASSQAPPQLASLVWDGTEYIGSTGAGSLWTTPDLKTWYQDVNLPGLQPIGVAAGGGHALLVSFDGQIAESAAGAGDPPSMPDLNLTAPDLPSTSASGQCAGTDPGGQALVYELTDLNLGSLGAAVQFDSLTGAFSMNNFSFNNRQPIKFLCRVSDGSMITASLVTITPTEAPPSGGGGGGTPPPAGGGKGGGGALGWLSLLALLGVSIVKGVGSRKRSDGRSRA